MSPTAVRVTGAHQPKQQRGHLRVAAILEAGIAVIKEKGYEAATMAEIAARSGTAIGSLYRFFPSKETLGDALLQQYSDVALGGLATLERQAPELTLDGLAAAFVDFMLAIQSHRSFAIALIDARGDSARRADFRAAWRSGVARIVGTALPALTPTKAEVVGITLVNVLKGVAAVADQAPQIRQLVLAEMRDLVRVYFASLQR